MKPNVTHSIKAHFDVFEDHSLYVSGFVLYSDDSLGNFNYVFEAKLHNNQLTKNEKCLADGRVTKLCIWDYIDDELDSNNSIIHFDRGEWIKNTNDFNKKVLDAVIKLLEKAPDREL